MLLKHLYFVQQLVLHYPASVIVSKLCEQINRRFGLPERTRGCKTPL